MPGFVGVVEAQGRDVLMGVCDDGGSDEKTAFEPVSGSDGGVESAQGNGGCWAGWVMVGLERRTKQHVNT